MAVELLPARSYLIDGEAVVCDQNGLAVFDLIRRSGATRHTLLSRSICPLGRPRNWCRASDLELEIVFGGAVDECAVDHSDPRIRIPILVEISDFAATSEVGSTR